MNLGNSGKNTHTQNQIFSLAKYYFSLRNFHIRQKIRNMIRLLKNNHKSVKL